MKRWRVFDVWEQQQQQLNRIRVRRQLYTQIDACVCFCVCICFKFKSWIIQLLCAVQSLFLSLPSCLFGSLFMLPFSSSTSMSLVWIDFISLTRAIAVQFDARCVYLTILDRIVLFCNSHFVEECRAWIHEWSVSQDYVRRYGLYNDTYTMRCCYCRRCALSSNIWIVLFSGNDATYIQTLQYCVLLKRFLRCFNCIPFEDLHAQSHIISETHVTWSNACWLHE